MADPTSNLSLPRDTLGDSAFKRSFRTAMGLLDDAVGAVLEGEATYDAASLADGAGASTTVTVTGAELGDYVLAVSFSLDLQGITLTGYVSDDDEVTVRLQNESGGTLDLAEGTLSALVRKKG